jgi:hypothetical protein
MTMLTQAEASPEPARRSPQGTATTDAANAHMATIKRFCIGALTVLAAGAAVAAIVALKAALFVWVFHYY